MASREALVEEVSLKMLPKGYYWRTGASMNRKRVPKKKLVHINDWRA